MAIIGIGIGGLQGGELLILFFIILLLFGAKRLPEMARSMGKAKKEFQEGLKDAEQEDGDKKDVPEPPTPAPPYAQPAPPLTPPTQQSQAEDKPPSAG